MSSLDSKIKLHPFHCPIESRLHPKVDEIEYKAIAWIDKFRFYKTEVERAWLIATNSAEFCARFAPNAIEENLLLFTQWIYWGFAFDDAKCDIGNQNTTQLAEFFAVANLALFCHFPE